MPTSKFMEKKALVDKEYLLEKFPGKGGWTYALIHDIPKEKRFPFGWMNVSGSIDDFVIQHYKLMPFGNGQLFLPVKAEIRKIIKKEAGDRVKITLFNEERDLAIPEEILQCLKDAPRAFEKFNQLSTEEQKVLIYTIMESKSQDIQVERIVRMVEKLDF